MTSGGDDTRGDLRAKWKHLVAVSGLDGTRAGSLDERIKTERRDEKKIDGRSLRRTGRVHQVNVRLKEETKEAIQRIAKSQDWLIGEVIERAVALLDAQLNLAKKDTPPKGS